MKMPVYEGYYRIVFRTPNLPNVPERTFLAEFDGTNIWTMGDPDPINEKNISKVLLSCEGPLELDVDTLKIQNRG